MAIAGGWTCSPLLHSALRRGGDLMGKGDQAHLSTLVHATHSSRKGLTDDCDNAHLHIPTCLPSL